MNKEHYTTAEDFKYLCKAYDFGGLLQYLETETDFFTAPASSKYHLTYEGGLVQHTLHVVNTLEWLTAHMDLEWGKARSPIVVGMLHDLCKINTYVRDGVEWKFNPHGKYADYVKNGEHGLLSLRIAHNCGVILTREEEACIHFHMGEWTKDGMGITYTEMVQKYPNLLWTHTADMYASQVLEV